MPERKQDVLNINTIRFLAVDTVEKARSGHPGAPMGAAAMVYVLWDKFLRHNPQDPRWINRDRFVLSAGHASALLYSLLFLTGYDVSLDDLKNFRQMNSKTPGHPEYGVTPGVEATTGPLGQGFANGVGMAIAEAWLAKRYNRPGFNLVDHHIYALVSDGDMQEGITSEAASLAGTLKLGKLIYLYDSNDIQIDGNTDLTFRENVSQRFKAYGWNVIGPVDGMSIDEVERSLNSAVTQTDRPNLIICKTIIGYGSPHKEGTNLAHGEPLGVEEVRLAKEKLGWVYQEPFSVPRDSLEYFRKAIDHGINAQKQWQELFDSYTRAFPEEAEELKSSLAGNLPHDWNKNLDGLFKIQSSGGISTRDASGAILNTIGFHIPFLMGGSADLAGSTRTVLNGLGDFGENNYSGRNIHFGLREHAMGAITNGLALHGGIIPFASTFLIFSDYLRPSIRLAAMMKLNLIYVFTHDSIGVGEDGPTHQPVEQIMSLRMVPNLTVIRPADAAETIEAWNMAISRKQGPVALVLTRQNIPILERQIPGSAIGTKMGAYILWESANTPQVILIGTGSEVHLALEAAKVLQSKGISARVVSLPAWNIFEEQSLEYKAEVLPPQITARISIEAGTPIGWERYTGSKGINIGISAFGMSAPGQSIFKHFNITVQEIVDKSLKIL